MPERRGPGGDVLVAVFVGGAVGTLLRAALAEAFDGTPATWPWPTFAANVIACLVLGWVATRYGGAAADSRVRPLLATGVCGGLSTFSTLQVELVRMLERDDLGLAAGYAATSVLAGLTAVAVGRSLARRGTRSAS